MRKLLLFFLIIAFNGLQAQVSSENAFPNLTFNYPVDIQNSGVSGDNRLFVVEQPGRIRVFQNQTNTSSSSLFLDITNKVNYTTGQEKGLLGLAFHPNYNQNGYFYVSYTGTSGGLIEVIIERYSVNSNNPNQANSNSGCEVLSFVKNQNNSNHNGGSIAFGPDGFLYISVGDGGGSGDPQGNSQNLNSLFGKILRININTSCPGYAIPSGNPFISSSGRNEIYALGLRNTWRISFDFNTNRLWGGDVGQDQLEEINIIQSGRNYGWNRYEASNTFNSSTPNPPNPTFPIYTYNHFQNDLSITGGYVYRGSQISNANLFGKYVFADFVSGRVWSLDYNAQNGATNRSLLFDTNFNISTFGQDINREIYFAAYGSSGRLYKLVESQSNPCAGQGGDSDGDGVCNNQDCQPFNNSFPATPGSSCNDGNSNTTNDVVTANGCDCTGTTTANCSVTTGNCFIRLNGLNNGDLIKVFNSSFQVIWECSQFNNNICNSTETITGLSNGTYFVQGCGGNFDPYTISGCGQTDPCAGQGGDSDGDGICNNQDCQPNNSSFPTTPGTSCNDGNSNTTNDVVTSNGCGCAGTPISSACSVSIGNCSITFNGLDSEDFVKVFNSSAQEIWRCSQYGNASPCNSTETVTGLNNGTYFVQACGELKSYELTGCGQSSDSNACSVSTGSCSITFDGLDSEDFVKIFNASAQEIWRCSQYGNASPCNSTETVTNLNNGTYFVQACGELRSYELTGCSSLSGSNGCESITNVAQGKNAQQSSTITAGGVTGFASKAVDGNTNGSFFISNSSIAATQEQSQPYWEVDLQSNSFIEEIKVYNRTDGDDKSRNAYVLVSDQPFTSSNLSTARSQADFEFFISGLVGRPSIISPELEGRYVRVQMRDQGFLTLAEVEVMGCTAIPLLSVNANANILYFDGWKKDRAVELNWIINKESINNYYIIERSKDGVNFEFLSKIDSKGNSLSPVTYNMLDNNPFYGKNYYRLIQTLSDGTRNYSNIYSTTFNIDLHSFTIFPNPAKDKINVNLKEYTGQSALIQIFDLRGILIKEKQVDSISEYPEEIDLKTIRNGLYLMSIKLDSRRSISKKFTITKLY